jgi:hypothetical protein
VVATVGVKEASHRADIAFDVEVDSAGGATA